MAGKPEPPLFEETLRRVGGERPLVVGDRLDTDIEGAVRAGYDSLLVMTGVTGLAELVGRGAGQRPTYLSADLGGLLAAAPGPVEADGGWELGGWRGRRSRRDALRGRAATGTSDDWWRVVAAAAWGHLDGTGDRSTPPA